MTKQLFQAILVIGVTTLEGHAGLFGELTSEAYCANFRSLLAGYYGRVYRLGLLVK